MAIFLSMYINKIDDKKRVSIPAPFRAIVEKQGEANIYAYPSLTNQCLEVCTIDRIQHIESHIETFDLFSEEREILSTAILAACEPMQIDAKGRVCLSDRLVEFAQIEQDVVFVGKGKTFEIWNKVKFESYFAQAREFARNKNLFKQQKDS